MLKKEFDRTLILLRGLPGSGKTTLAALLSEDQKYPCFSVDDYFTQGDHYLFIAKENHLAYEQCLNNCKEAMKNGTKKIFIHNTLTINWEIESYFKAAAEFKYDVFVVTVENYHSGKNKHEVNEEQLNKMAEKYKVKLL